MKEIILGNHIRKVPSVAVGCMRLSKKSKDEMNRFIHAALEQGAYLFDLADIYGDGMSESIFIFSQNVASVKASMISQRSTF